MDHIGPQLTSANLGVYMESRSRSLGPERQRESLDESMKNGGGTLMDK